MVRLLLYKLLTPVWLTAFIVGIYLVTVEDAFSTRVAICLGAVTLTLLTQALILRCVHCGARPGVYLLAIWTLLLDYELYFADTLLLRHRPKCGRSLNATSTEQKRE